MIWQAINDVTKWSVKTMIDFFTASIIFLAVDTEENIKAFKSAYCWKSDSKLNSDT